MPRQSTCDFFAAPSGNATSESFSFDRDNRHYGMFQVVNTFGSGNWTVALQGKFLTSDTNWVPIDFGAAPHSAGGSAKLTATQADGQIWTAYYVPTFANMRVVISGVSGGALLLCRFDE